MTTRVITRLSPSHSIFSSNGGEKSTGSLLERDSRVGSRLSVDPLERPAITCGFSISEAFGETGWWDSSGVSVGREIE